MIINLELLESLFISLLCGAKCQHICVMSSRADCCTCVSFFCQYAKTFRCQVLFGGCEEQGFEEKKVFHWIQILPLEFRLPAWRKLFWLQHWNSIIFEWKQNKASPHRNHFKCSEMWRWLCIHFSLIPPHCWDKLWILRWKSWSPQSSGLLEAISRIWRDEMACQQSSPHAQLNTYGTGLFFAPKWLTQFC